MTDSVIILPETDEKTLCLAFTGIVTKEDHYAALVEPMRSRIEKHGYYNLVLWFKEDFQGYAADAADQSFVAIRDMGKHANHMAFINPTERKLFQNNLMRAQLGRDVRNFNEEDLAAAIAWAKEG